MHEQKNNDAKSNYTTDTNCHGCVACGRIDKLTVHFTTHMVELVELVDLCVLIAVFYTL